MSGPAPRPLTVRPCRGLRGTVTPVGDKSMTHRALILAGIARGRSRIVHPNPGEDCRGTAEAVAQLGVAVATTAEGWEIEGAAGLLRDPEGILDLGNSGTGIRLMAGFLAGQSLYAVLTGDRSLRRRPMRRIAEPLAAMGATILLREGEYPPIAIRGGTIHPIEVRLPVASAQVKSSILLAALGLEEGEVVVEEPGPSRDHTERILSWLGVPIVREPSRVRLRGPIGTPRGFLFEVPGDPSAAAFYLVAATIIPGSELTLKSVSLNPTRTGIHDVLRAMGADLTIEESRGDLAEPVGTIRVRSASLRGTTIDGPTLLRALDEVPVLAIAAVAAEGETVFRDAGELRVKESDRIESTAALVRAVGGEVETGPDWIRIRGCGALGGGRVEARGDHRIAMSAIVAGCAAKGPVQVDDVGPIATSDPTFLESIAHLGADLA